MAKRTMRCRLVLPKSTRKKAAKRPAMVVNSLMTMNEGASRLPGLPARTIWCCFFSRYPTGVKRRKKPEILSTIGPIVRWARGLASSSSRTVPALVRPYTASLLFMSSRARVTPRPTQTMMKKTSAETVTTASI